MTGGSPGTSLSFALIRETHEPIRPHINSTPVVWHGLQKSVGTLLQGFDHMRPTEGLAGKAVSVFASNRGDTRKQNPRTWLGTVRCRYLLCALACSASFGMQTGSTVSAPPSAGRSGQNTARLYRDQYGMPHIYADREENGFFALGYALAEDRLDEVLTYYVAVRGELAAKFGRKTPGALQEHLLDADARESVIYDSVASDISVRKYMLLEKARRNLRQLPPQFQKDVRAYVEGISAYMRDHPSLTPDWAPKLEAALPLALYHLHAHEQSQTCRERREADRAASGAHGPQMDFSRSPLEASNAWAVAGSHTADGGVIFASDSHGAIGSIYGTTFYPYRLKAGHLDIVAFDWPGAMQFLFGHSAHYAWGLTEGTRFVADCYRVKVNAKAPGEYLFDGSVQKMMTVPYRIDVKGERAITGTFEYTNHNGVLSPVEDRDDNTAYVVSYAYADRIGLGAGEGYRIATAKSRRDLESALAQRDMYPANLVLGGADGTIMYIRAGRIPIRPPGVDVRYVLDGNTSATAWRGIHSYADLLKVVDPPQGYVGNDNTSPDTMYSTAVLISDRYPDYFAFEPGKITGRQQRLIEMLDDRLGLSVEDAIAVMMDETVVAARSWGPVFRKLLTDKADSLEVKTPELRDFVEKLAGFTGALSRESTAALYFEYLQRALHDNHEQQVSALQEAAETGYVSLEQEDVLLQATAEARTMLLANYGRLNLTWGDVHRIRRGAVDLPIGGGVIEIGDELLSGSEGSVFKRLVGRGASTRALRFRMDPSTKMEYLISGQRIPFLVHFAADGVQSYMQTLWGVSDQPTSTHYADQARLASEKILRPIPLSVSALARDHATESVLVVRRH
jgi:acyl-homoserine-lactone acylase